MATRKTNKIKIHIFEEMYDPFDTKNWWSVRSEYANGDTFEIGCVSPNENQATLFALEQVRHYRNMMEDHSFEIVLHTDDGEEVLTRAREKALRDYLDRRYAGL